MTSPSICHYGLIGRLCTDYAPDGGRCLTHEHPRWIVCVNGHEATHVCPEVLPGGARCMVALCDDCVHAGETHQHIDEIPQTLQGSAQGPVARRDRRTTLDLLAGIVGDKLVQLQTDGALTLGSDVDPEEIGVVLVHELGVHALAGLLMGAAVTR